MRIYPTKREFFTRTVPLCTLLVSIIFCWFYKEKSDLFEGRWDEVIETAKFNDLDGDGISNVIILYNRE